MVSSDSGQCPNVAPEQDRDQSGPTGFGTDRDQRSRFDRGPDRHLHVRDQNVTMTNGEYVIYVWRRGKADYSKPVLAVTSIPYIFQLCGPIRDSRCIMASDAGASAASGQGQIPSIAAEVAFANERMHVGFATESMPQRFFFGRLYSLAMPAGRAVL